MDLNKTYLWLQDGVVTARRYENKFKANGMTEDLLRERRALQDKQFYDVLFEGLEFDLPVSVLNIGCGLGGMIDYIRVNKIEMKEYLGIDLVRNFIEACSYNYGSTNPNYEFSVGNFINWKFPPQKKYDLVVCLGMLVTRTHDYENYVEYMVNKMVALSRRYVLFNIITEIAPTSQNYQRQACIGGTASIKEQNLVKILDHIKLDPPSGTQLEYAIRQETIYPDATDAFVRIKVTRQPESAKSQPSVE